MLHIVLKKNTINKETLKGKQIKIEKKDVLSTRKPVILLNIVFSNSQIKNKNKKKSR